MINGILVVNHYMRSAKFDDLYNMFIQSALDNNINLSVRTNREINYDMDTFFKKKSNINDISIEADMNKPNNDIKDTLNNNNNNNNNNIFNEHIDFILFWDKDILLARRLETKGFLVFNSSEAIRVCDDKALTYIELDKYGIAMPRTIISPFTYDEVYNEYNNGYIEDVASNLGFPMIAKARFGSFGAQVHKIDNISQLEDIIKYYPASSLIFQEYIETSHGRDVRLQVVGDKVVASMYRYSENDFRANITNGGQMKEYTPSEEECDLAIEAVKALELDFAGVDLLYGHDNTMLVCEVNSNAHFRNLYNLTKINVADEILKYIKYKIHKR